VHRAVKTINKQILMLATAIPDNDLQVHPYIMSNAVRSTITLTAELLGTITYEPEKQICGLVTQK